MSRAGRRADLPLRVALRPPMCRWRCRKPCPQTDTALAYGLHTVSKARVKKREETAMENGVRYAKTRKGVDEIGQRRNTLSGKLRIMLILVDPTKTIDQLLTQAARIGAPADCLDTMVRDGYIAPVMPIAASAAA
jgi:hypothetical protein